MDLTRKEIELLAHKMLIGKISPGEQILFNNWINTQVQRESCVIDGDFDDKESDLRDRMLSKILEDIKEPKNLNVRPRYFFLLRNISIAATLLAFFAIGFYFFRMKQDIVNNIDLVELDNIIAENGSAILVFANGDSISLNSDKKGIVIDDNKILYESDNSLALNIDPISSSKTELFTLKTPKGSTFKLTLPDGSIVWLNANSQIVYPKSFREDFREISFVGEGYFEIAEDKNKPFVIKSKKQEICVLGTEFNVCDYYDDEASYTTLIEGGIKVRPINSPDKKFERMYPNTQAVVSSKDLDIKKVDVNSFVAWKAGMFYFNGSSPQNALNQLSHWYDLEVLYVSDIPQINFFGIIDRKKSLGSILRILEKSGLKFRVDKVKGKNKLIIL